MCTLPFCDIEQSRLISGCSGMPWVWYVPRYPLGLLPRPCVTFGSADARDRAQIWRNFKFENTERCGRALIAWVMAKATSASLDYG